jgi:hypothetical protein
MKTTGVDTKFRLKAIDSVKYTEKMRMTTMSDLPDVDYKFASLDFIKKNTTDYVRMILDRVPIVGEHRNILVDSKVHYLKKGQTPALPHWHFDCVGDPRDEALEENHHLFITEGCSTNFLKEEVEIDLPFGFSHSIFNGLVGQKIEPYRIYSYRRHLHQATPAEKDCVRLLIRVTESNLIKPNNKKFKVTYR